MPAAAFDYNQWLVRYPEFTTTVSSDAAAALFAEAQLYLSNTDCPIPDPAIRLVLFGMLVAHLAQMSFGSLGPAGPVTPSPIVGRISSATEGSVSITADNGSASGSELWFTQTKYGFNFWQATTSARAFQYVADPMAGMGQRPVGWGLGLFNGYIT